MHFLNSCTKWKSSFKTHFCLRNASFMMWIEEISHVGITLNDSHNVIKFSLLLFRNTQKVTCQKQIDKNTDKRTSWTNKVQDFLSNSKRCYYSNRFYMIIGRYVWHLWKRVFLTNTGSTFTVCWIVTKLRWGNVKKCGI